MTIFFSIEVLAQAIRNEIRDQFAYIISVFMQEPSFFKNIVANNTFQIERVGLLYVAILKSPFGENSLLAIHLNQLEENELIAYNNICILSLGVWTNQAK